jgi:hypothetical protein
VLVQVKNEHESSLLVRPPGVEKTSRLGSRDPVASRVKCEPHGGKNGKMNSWTVSWLSDRGEMPDILVSGDNFDLVGGDPHNLTTTSETRSANAIAERTPDGYRPCWRKISLITKINSCAQSKNEQESEASNLNITRRWSLNYTTAARWWLFGCS